MFLAPKANLPDTEKSRLELHLQQIAECIGFDRILLPVLSRKVLFELYEASQDPQQVIAFLGKHLDHDTHGLRLSIVPQVVQSSCGGGCGGGSCKGPSSLPGRYDASKRMIILETSLASDLQLALAALIDGVVRDLLAQNEFDLADLPEWVELAVVGTGLGVVRSGISLVKAQVNCWDSTQWYLVPRPFLDGPSLAYVNAIAAWARNDPKPEWSNDFPSDLKRPFRNSLQYLLKTNDSFFRPQAKPHVLSQTQSEWWKLASNASESKDSASSQVIAMRHLEFDGDVDPQQESLLLKQLRSTNPAITLHAIAAAEQLLFHRQAIEDDFIVRQLSRLMKHRDDEVRAKALCTIAKVGALDEPTIDHAARMLEENARHLHFASVYAFSTLDSVPDELLPALDECFVSVLRACDYEFIDLLVRGYKRWLEDPGSHFESLLKHTPELLPIALETLQNAPKQFIQLRRGA